MANGTTRWHHESRGHESKPLLAYEPLLHISLTLNTGSQIGRDGRKSGERSENENIA